MKNLTELLKLLAPLLRLYKYYSGVKLKVKKEKIKLYLKTIN